MTDALKGQFHGLGVIHFIGSKYSF